MRALAAAFLLCAACAATMRAEAESAFKAQMDTWVGANEIEVYRGFGKPDNEYTMPNGDRVLVYETQTGVATRGGSTAVGGRTIAAMGTSSVSQELNCRTELELDNATGLVVSWRSRGTYCR